MKKIPKNYNIIRSNSDHWSKSDLEIDAAIIDGQELWRFQAEDVKLSGHALRGLAS